MFDHGKCTTYAVVKLKPEKKSGLIDSNSWSLRYQCSVLPTELSRQLGAGNWAGSPVIITQSLIVLLNCDFSCLQDLSLLAWLVTRCLATVCLVTRSTQLQEWNLTEKVCICSPFVCKLTSTFFPGGDQLLVSLVYRCIDTVKRN